MSLEPDNHQHLIDSKALPKKIISAITSRKNRTCSAIAGTLLLAALGSQVNCGGTVQVTEETNTQDNENDARAEAAAEDTGTIDQGSDATNDTDDANNENDAFNPCDVNYWVPIESITVDSSNYKTALETFLADCPKYEGIAEKNNAICTGKIPQQVAEVFCNNLPGGITNKISWYCPLLESNSGSQGFSAWGFALVEPQLCALTFTEKL